MVAESHEKVFYSSLGSAFESRSEQIVSKETCLSFILLITMPTKLSSKSAEEKIDFVSN